MPLLRAGKYEEAIEAFTTAIASHPNEPFSYKYRGEAYQALGRHKEAQDDYQRVAEGYTLAIASNPTIMSYYNSRAEAYEVLGRPDDVKRNYQEAVRAFTKAIASGSTNITNYRNRAEAYQALGWQLEAQADLKFRRSPLDTRSESGGGRDRVMFGVRLVGGGSIASIANYVAAAPGETYFYFVFWGVMVWGVIEVVRGLMQSSNKS